jgi:chromosome segregation ATPase
MAIPSVVQGMIETKDGKVFELDSPKGTAWVEAIGSFRFEPTGNSKACTVRREPSGYWYGCRKITGKVRKKYIGKTSEVSTAKLEEIAAALEVPPVAQVNKVAEVAQEVTQDRQVAQKVVEVAEDRLTALELEVANLRKALEALQEVLPGKSKTRNLEELPKVDNAVAEELQNELGNLKTENEKLRTHYDALLESSTVVADNLRRGVRELQAQLEQERADREEVEAQLAGRHMEITELRAELKAEQTRYEELDEEFREFNGQWNDCKKEIRQLEAEISDLKQKLVATTSKDLPEVADLLNQLKARRKKSTATLGDIEKILEILEASSENLF